MELVQKTGARTQSPTVFSCVQLNLYEDSTTQKDYWVNIWAELSLELIHIMVEDFMKHSSRPNPEGVWKEKEARTFPKGQLSPERKASPRAAWKPPANQEQFQCDLSGLKKTSAVSSTKQHNLAKSLQTTTCWKQANDQRGSQMKTAFKWIAAPTKEPSQEGERIPIWWIIHQCPPRRGSLGGVISPSI